MPAVLRHTMLPSCTIIIVVCKVWHSLGSHLVFCILLLFVMPTSSSWLTAARRLTRRSSLHRTCRRAALSDRFDTFKLTHFRFLRPVEIPSVPRGVPKDGRWTPRSEAPPR